MAILMSVTLAFSAAAAYEVGIRLSLVFFVLAAVFASVLAGNQLGKERITAGSIHLLGVWLMLCLAPLLDYRSGLMQEHFTSYHFFPFLPTTEELVLSSVSVMFWLLCVAIVYRTNVNRAVSWIRTYDLNLGGFAILVQIATGIVALVYIYQQVGFGVFTRLGFESFEYDTPGEFTFFLSTVRSVPLIALLALVLALQNGRLSGLAKAAGIGAAVALLVGNVLINNPVAAARFFTGTLVLAFAYVLIFRGSRNGLSFTVTALIGALIVFPLLDIGRFAATLDTLADDIPTFVGRLLSQDPFRSFEMIPVALRYLEEQGSTRGYQLLGPLLFWVPRTFWPEKPEGSGWLLGKYFGGFHENIACPTPCEALVNFGWVGIPLVALAFGIGLRIVDEIARSSEGRAAGAKIPLSTVIFPLLLGQIFFLTRGDFMSPWSFTVGMMLATLPLVAGELLSRAAAGLLAQGSRSVPDS